MYEFKKVEIWSLTKFYAITGLFIGFIAGIILAIAGSVLNSYLGSIEGATMISSFGSPWLALILLPIFYGFAGLIGGVLSALIYNGVSKIVGGVRFEVEEVEEGKSAQ